MLTNSILVVAAACVTSVSAAATPELYKIYVTQPSSSQILSIAWDHAGATSFESDLQDINQFPSIDYYLKNGRLFSPSHATTYPDLGYTFDDVGSVPGSMAIVGSQFGLQGRDDWTVGADGSLTVPSQGPSSSFFQCKWPVEGGLANALAYGNPFANGSLPQGCTYTVQLFVTPA